MSLYSTLKFEVGFSETSAHLYSIKSLHIREDGTLQFEGGLSETSAHLYGIKNHHTQEDSTLHKH